MTKQTQPGLPWRITAILIVDKDVRGEMVESISKRLVGTCRIFVLPADFSLAKINTALLPLSSPDVMRETTHSGVGADFADALMLLKADVQGSEATDLVRLSRGCRTAKEMSARLVDEFLRRVKEIEDALTEPEA